LYLPKEWVADKGRCREAGIPADVKHETKPELALEMLKRAFASGTQTDWVVGDNVYGCFSIRNYLQEMNQQLYLLINRYILAFRVIKLKNYFPW